jgi:hypothetical protein
MKAPKRLCKCDCGHTLPAGRADRQFIDDGHRKKWLRRQHEYQVGQAVKRGGLSEEYLEVADSLREAQETAQEVAQILSDDAEMFAQCLHGLCVGPVEKRSEYASILSDLRTDIAGRRKLLGFVLDFIDQAEAALLAGQLGEVADDVLLAVVAAVPGIELTGEELTPDEDEEC